MRQLNWQAYAERLNDALTAAFSHWAIVVALMLALTALAAPYLGDAIWYDENRTLFYAGAPVYDDVSNAEAVQRIADNRWQAPIYFLLLRAWGAGVGWEVFTLRVPSLYFGLLTVAGTYHIVKRFFNVQVAFYAVFTMSVSAFYVNFLHEMRTYTLLMALVVVMVWAYAWITSGRGPLWAGYTLFTLAVAGLVYVHYYNVFPVAGLGLFHLFGRFRKPRYWQTLACFAMAGVLFLPWAQVLLGGLDMATDDQRIVRNMTFSQAVNNVGYFFGNGNRAFVFFLALLAVPFIRSQNQTRFTWVWLLASFGVAFAATRVFPMLTETRYLLFLWMPLAVLVALGIDRLKGIGVPPAVILLLWAVLAARMITNPDERTLIHPWYTPPLDKLVLEMEGRTREGDHVLFHLPPNIRRTLDQTILDLYLRELPLTRTRFIPDLNATTDIWYANRVIDAAEGADRVWITYETPIRNWRVGPVTEETLPQQGFALCGLVEETPQVHMTVMARQPDGDGDAVFRTTDGHPIDIYLLHEPTVQSDRTVELNLGWYVDREVPPGLHSLAVHIENEAGEIVAQLDDGLTDGNFACRYDSFSLAGAESGAYTVKATVYQWQNGERLAPEPATPDSRQTLATFFLR